MADKSTEKLPLNMPPPTQEEWANRFVDYYVDQALAAAKQSVAGTWDKPYPQLPGDLFAELKPEERELYMKGLRNLPEQWIAQFFGMSPFQIGSHLTKDQIDKFMSNYEAIHKTGPEGSQGAFPGD